jgi:hypothetical protein
MENQEMPEKRTPAAESGRQRKGKTPPYPQRSIRIDPAVAIAARHQAMDEGRWWSELVEQAIVEYMRRHPTKR